MKQSLDAAIHTAHEKSSVEPKLPKAVSKPAAKVPAKAGAPAVKVDKSNHRVRLRNIDHALPVCVSTRDKGDIRVSLEPNKWTTVPDEVYELLKSKFYAPQIDLVPDWNGDVNNPVRTTRKDETQEYIIEFPDEP